MSYSRWSNSRWYTYSHVDGGFKIEDVFHFTDKQLQDLDSCMVIVKNIDTDASDEELKELREYMEDYKKERLNDQAD